MVIHDLKHPTESAISQISNLERNLNDVKTNIKDQTKDIKFLAKQLKKIWTGNVDSKQNQ